MAILVITGCQPETSSPKKNTNPWLAEIRQDTPFVIANETPLKDAEFDRLAQTIQPLVTLIGEHWHTPEAPLMQSLTSKLTNAQDWRTAGLDPNGFWAVYADNDSLVARIPLLDETAFWNTWVDAKAPSPAQQANPSSLQQDEADQRLVIRADFWDSAWPADSSPSNPIWLIMDSDESWLSVRLQQGKLNEIGALREQRPMTGQQGQSDHWSATAWSAFNQTHGLDGKISAYLDWASLVAQQTQGDANCRQAMSELGAQLPKLIMGSQDLSPQAMGLLIRVMRPKGMLAEATPRPSIDVSAAQFAQVAGMGLIVDIPTMRQTLIDQLQYSQTAVEDCPELSAMRQPRRWARSLSNRPVPPIFTSIEGIMMQFNGVEASEQQSPEVGYLTEIHLQNPQFLIGLAGLFAPEMASLDLRANQPPQPLPPALVEALGGVPMYLSTTETSLRISSAHTLDAPDPVARAESGELPWASGTLNLRRLDELSAVMPAWAMTQQGQTLIDELTDWSRRSGMARVQWRVQPADEGIDVVINTQH